MSDQFEEICNTIASQTGYPPKGSATVRKGLCPSHSDEKPSLSIRRDDEHGLVGITCHAGCSFDDVREALGLDARAFRLGEARTNGHRPRTVAKARQAKRSEPVQAGAKEIERYPYTDSEGRVLYYNVRFEPKDFRMAGPDGKVRQLPKGMARVPYNLPAVLAAVETGQTVYWVEGERDVHTLTAAGYAATTTAGGALAPLDPEWAAWFEGAHVVVVEDLDKSGRHYARQVAKLLVNVADVETLKPATPQAKSDVTDHLRAGYTLEQLLPSPMRSVRRTRWTIADIIETAPEPIRWVLPGMIPEGLTLLVGAPKVGKSWMNLNLIAALGSGRPDIVFNWGAQVDPSPNLYCALEDPARRINSRLRQVTRGMQFPARQAGDIWLELPELDKGGREEIEKWLEAHPTARCVLVDVLAKVRGAPPEGQGMYQADYHAVTQLKEIADDYGVGIVVTHHDRKKTSEDFLDMVSGTKGVTGAADTILYLTRDRGSTEGVLKLESRDVEECQYRMEFHKPSGRWLVIEQERIGSEVNKPAVTLLDQIGQILLARGHARATELAKILEVDLKAVVEALQSGAEMAAVAQQRDGTWHVPRT